MALKRLGAIVSGGVIGTANTLFTATGPTVVSTILISNTDTSSHTFRLAISTGTSLPAVLGRIGGTFTIAANDAIPLTIGATMDSTNNKLLCSSDSVLVGFQAFGDDGS